MEDILWQFNVFVSDFYDEASRPDANTFCREFASQDIEDIRNIRTLIGKRVYNVEYEKDGQVHVKLVIE